MNRIAMTLTVALFALVAFLTSTTVFAQQQGVVELNLRMVCMDQKDGGRICYAYGKEKDSLQPFLKGDCQYVHDACLDGWTKYRTKQEYCFGQIVCSAPVVVKKIVSCSFQPANTVGCDFDGDGIQNENDNCPLDKNPGQQNMDGDAWGNTCDDDADGDSIIDVQDNCKLTPNSSQANQDGDEWGDICDNCPCKAGQLGDNDECLYCDGEATF